MNRRTYLAEVATVAAAGLAGCGAPSDSEGTPTDGGEPPSTVQMVTDGSDFYFDPIGLLVEPGETITFRIQSGDHSSTAYHPDNGDDASRIPEEADPWNSETLTEDGATFDYTFDVEGTYDYYCIPHRTLGMVGRIVVGSPGGPAEDSSIPNGSVPESSTIVDQGAVSWDEFTG